MKLIDTDETVLIVTGSDVPAEMADRPVAYALKNEIDRLGGGVTWRFAVVVGDRWYADNRLFHLCSTVIIGGPGVNAVAAALVEELPMLTTIDERVFLQGSWDSEMKRVSLWGLDRAATAQAVETFLRDGHCTRFLTAAWKLRAPARDLDLA